MLELINTRRSVRQFKADEVSKTDILELLEAAMNAPSAGNEQAWQFVVLDREKLEAYWDVNRNMPKGAPVGILVCGDRSKQRYEGFFLHDCCAAIENILLAAHTKGLGAVWTEAFEQNRNAIRKMFDLPDHIEPVACVPVGIPAKPQPSFTSRFNEKNIHWNQW